MTITNLLVKCITKKKCVCQDIGEDKRGLLYCVNCGRYMGHTEKICEHGEEKNDV